MFNVSLITVAKLSLAFLWFFTALTSLFLAPEIGYEILGGAGIEGSTADILVVGGSLVDVAMGVWLLSSRATKLCCLVQVCLIVCYSIFLTFIEASFWFHPFGPLTKNVPIVALIILIYSSSVVSKDARIGKERL